MLDIVEESSGIVILFYCFYVQNFYEAIFIYIYI